jgi:hypothetical protein
MQLYYRSKYLNYFEIAEASNTAYESLKTNSLNRIVKERKKIRKELNDKFNKEVEKLRKELETEYNEACEEVKTELFEKLEEIDTIIGKQAEKNAAKNILTFSCSCSRDLIPVAIDFSKENTFVCKKCNSKYKIAINANPILIGRGISDEEFANLVESRLNEGN